MAAKKNQTTKNKPEGDQDLELKKPKLDERWIMEIEGNQFVKFSGLLDVGHQIGISGIDVELLQFPTKDNGNFAICRATVISKTGESFTDIGDANPGNCNSKVVKHLLRLSSTRAIARALRTFTNIGYVCIDELSDLDDAVGLNTQSAGINPGADTKAGKNPSKKATASKETGKNADQGKKSTQSKSADNKANGPGGNGSGDGKNTGGNGSQAPGTLPAMSEAQSRAIHNLAQRRGFSDEDLEQYCLETFGIEVEHLSNGDAAAFIRQLQKAA